MLLYRRFPNRRNARLRKIAHFHMEIRPADSGLAWTG